MAATTTQLGLVTPTQGDLTGTWGNTVNNGITEYTNIAIAGTLTLTGDGAVTLSNTTGDASASNITSTLTGAGTVTAQFAIVRVTGTLTTAKIITAPSYSKTYLVVNAATGSTVSFIRSGQTPAISIAVGESALVYFNGTDYVKVAGTTSGAAAGSNTQVQYNSSGVLAGSANMTFNGTTLTVNDLTDSSLTATRVTYAGTAGNLVDSANLTFDGTNLTVGGSETAARFIPSGSTVATNGMYLPAANSLGFSTNSTEAIRIDSVGAVGIGGTAPAGTNVLIAKNITGAVTGQAVRVTSQIQADVTSEARAFISLLSTAASAPVGNVQHFFAGQGSLGAGSTISQQVGFNAASTLTGATNNFGFYGGIASGTGRFNLYMVGTADNYLGGNLGIGANAAGNTLLISKNITGAVFAFGTQNTSTIQSDVTSAAYGYSSQLSTQATSFTLPNLIHFIASQGTFGASSTVTNQYGFYANSPMTGATNNYGFYGNLASGTGRWNFYAAGTAENYFAGNVGIATTSPGSALDVKGTLRLSGATSGYVGLAPAAAAGSTTYTLPSTDGSSGQFLSTNGSGTLSWATGGGGGGGDVVGPSSATDNALVRFDTTTGKLIQNSVGILSDAGALSGLTTIDTSGVITQTKSSAIILELASGTGQTSSTGTVGIVSNGLGLGADTRSGFMFSGRNTSGTMVSILELSGASGAAVTGTLSVSTGAAVGGATAGAGGLAFPATAVAVANANTLDDYEEGTFTPAITGINSVTYTQQYGNYVKIGKQVTAFVRFLISGGTGSGAAVTITGLPFTAASAANGGNGGGAVTYKQLTASAIYPTLSEGTTTILLFLTETSAPTDFTLSGAQNGYLFVSVTYLV